MILALRTEYEMLRDRIDSLQSKEKRRLAMGAGQGVGPSRAPVIHHHQDGQPRQFYGLPAGAVIYDHALNVCAVVSQYDGQIARIFATTPIVAHGVHSFTML